MSHPTEPTAPDYGTTARKHLPLLGGVVLAITALSVAYTLLSAPIYRFRTIVVIPPTSDPTAAVASPFARSDPLGVLEGVANSPGIITYVAKVIGETEQNTDRLLNVQSTPLASQIELDVDHKDQALARKASEAWLQGLRTSTDRIVSEVGGANAEKLRRELDDREAELRTLEGDAIRLQKSVKALPNPATNDYTGLEYGRRVQDLKIAIAKNAASLAAARATAEEGASAVAQGRPLGGNAANNELDRRRSELTDLEARLATLLQNRGPEDAEVVSVRNAVRVARESLAGVVARYRASAQAGTTDEIAPLEAERQVLTSQLAEAQRLADEAPQEGVSLQRIQTEIGIRRDVLRDLRVQYERQKISNEAPISNWSVLVAPRPDQKPANKSLAIAILRGFAIGAAIAALLLLRFQRRALLRAQAGA